MNQGQDSKNKGFVGRFRSSLVRWSEENSMIFYDYDLTSDVTQVIEGLYEEKWTPNRYKAEGRIEEWRETSKLAQSFLNAFLIQELTRRTDGPGCLHNLLELVDSPIEAALMLSLILCAREQYMQIDIQGQVTGRRHPVHACFEEPGSHSKLLILPQTQIGDYRVDYLMRLSRTVEADWEGAEDDGGLSRRPFQTTIEKQIIVECDGHEFHEKTKEQARRDKSRDRQLQANGLPVYRFTGSEIYANPMTCAIETLNALKGSSEDASVEQQ
jgi:hypothetical protein